MNSLSSKFLFLIIPIAFNIYVCVYIFIYIYNDYMYIYLMIFYAAWIFFHLDLLQLYSQSMRKALSSLLSLLRMRDSGSLSELPKIKQIVKLTRFYFDINFLKSVDYSPLASIKTHQHHYPWEDLRILHIPSTAWCLLYF